MKLFILAFYCLIPFSYQKPSHNETSEVTNNIKKIKCEGVLVNGKLHKRSTLMNGINRPYQLAYYSQEHLIFYSYNAGQDTQDTFGIAYVKINDTMPTEVFGVKNGFALAIDKHNKKIYYGGSDGIYDADLTKIEEIKHIIKGRDVWDIFYHKNHLYFVEFPSQRLHKYDIKEKKISPHEHKCEIYQFVIDRDNDIFITTKEGVFEIKSGTNVTIPYSGPKIFRAIEVNDKGVAHFCAKNGIYVADKSNHSLIEIASIKNIFGLAFDNEDNIIYASPHEIIKLLPHDCN